MPPAPLAAPTRPPASQPTPGPAGPDPARRGLRIGLTGGIGSGKSRVAAELQALGAGLIDTDAIARALTAPGGAALPALVAAFGPQVLAADGSLDRGAMRERVFADPALRRQLEALLHPLIGAEVDARLAAAPPGRVQVLEVPLLVEHLARWRPRVDRILVVDCPPAQQITRTQRRSGWPRAQVEAVMAQQAPREARRAVADAVIDNATDDPAALRAAVQRLWTDWVGGG